MRIRTVKPEFWQHRMHRRISEPAALLALALLNLADDEGRFEADAPVIAQALFPRRPLSKPVHECLEELRVTGFLVFYTGRLDGMDVELCQVVSFRRHQVINRPTPSRLPPPPQGAITEDSRSNQGAITEDSLSGRDPLHAGKERKGREGIGKEGSVPRTHAREESGPGAIQTVDLEKTGAAFPEVAVPTVAEVVAFGAGGAGVPPEYCRYYHGRKEITDSWVTGGGKAVKWKLEIMQWYGRDREKPDLWKKRGTEKPGAEVTQWEAELEAEEDPAKRRELREKISRAS